MTRCMLKNQALCVRHCELPENGGRLLHGASHGSRKRRPSLATNAVQKAINRMDLKALDRANMATGNSTSSGPAACRRAMLCQSYPSDLQMRGRRGHYGMPGLHTPALQGDQRAQSLAACF